MKTVYDVAIIGGGIIGLATARAIAQDDPSKKVVLFEKEGSLAGHQTGRNSGVIHAGVYYRPGSEKARLCAAGRLSMVEFCKEYGVAHEICGKLVIATDERELGRLDDLLERCRANEVPVERIGPERIRELEPHAAGIAGLHVPVTGIVDYPGVCAVLAQQLRAADVELSLGNEVTGMAMRRGRMIIETDRGEVEARAVVNCGGLQSDRVARRLAGSKQMDDVRIVPFRGEYFELAPSRSHLVRNLIYPVPDPRFPFLGVHLTRGISGRVHAGPNAVLALAREGYSWRDHDLHDIAEYLRFPGFRIMAKQHWRSGLEEMRRSLSRTVFTKALQRLVPAVREADLEPAASGVRAQAVLADGTLADDFLFRQQGRVLNVLNAPSPGATAALEIGRVVAARLG